MILNIPFMSEKSRGQTRLETLNELRRAGADRAFICPPNPYGDKEKLKKITALLKENVDFYRAEGFSPVVWINGIGHGGDLPEMDLPDTEESKTWAHLTGLGNGATAPDSFCPLDTRFTAMYTEYLRAVAETGPDIIMVDDDLRMGFHGKAMLCCACDLHMKLFNDRAAAAGLTDRILTREDLAETLFTGEANPLRRLWLEIMGETLLGFCRRLRETVDEVDPTIRLGHCACLTTWDTDGTDSIEMAKVLAGGTKPLLRLIGAPYWAGHGGFEANNIGVIADAERMQAEWCRACAPEIEIFSEGDAYPRPRYKTPSTYIECFDQILLAEGRLDGILKYMLDYTHDPEYETGYIHHHIRNTALREQLTAAFGGKETAGVWVFEAMHKIASSDCSDFTENELAAMIIPKGAQLAMGASLPTAYMKTAYTNAQLVFGDNAKYCGETDLPRILDAKAALLLGEDVGIRGSEPMEAPASELFRGVRVPVTVESTGRFYRFTLAEDAEVLSTWDNGAPAAWIYRNEAGKGYLVYSFVADTVDPKTPLYRSYHRQRQLFDALETLGAKSPARVEKCPWADVLCRKNGESMSVGVWNLSSDVAFPGRVRLDSAYEKVTFLNGAAGHLEGDTLVTDDMIPPFGFFGFTVSGKRG